ncbi:MAG: ATP-dependent Clp protease adapter ClpS [Bifidobacteriaceae bacterium]|jgi:ATP-dependent Clp protease adaptor protein ClpS|nr:ATP-dependent Clp protease adapter ClpS [Bifidobacteriaceae bacterium]
MSALPAPAQRADARAVNLPAKAWIVTVWDDPINLMSYVTYVFQTHFGFPRDTAERLMLAVHHEGRAVVATGPRETMELHCEAMHSYGLWATLSPQEA